MAEKDDTVMRLTLTRVNISKKIYILLEYLAIYIHKIEFTVYKYPQLLFSVLNIRTISISKGKIDSARILQWINSQKE